MGIALSSQTRRKLVANYHLQISVSALESFLLLTITISLEAKHLIWLWIMKVKGPKNQADFIEVLYVVVNAWGASF